MLMDPALFSAGNLFEAGDSEESGSSEGESAFVERDHEFPGVILRIREFSFHPVNANLLWPGSCLFADWLIHHQALLHKRRVLELGSGTGALAVYLKKTLGLDITTSDYNDEEIEHNIAYNCCANGVPVVPHIRHTWGGKFPCQKPDWDLILASDILLYVKQYPNLIKTLTFLLRDTVEITHDALTSNSAQTLSSQSEQNVKEPTLEHSKVSLVDADSHFLQTGLVALDHLVSTVGSSKGKEEAQGESRDQESLDFLKVSAGSVENVKKVAQCQNRRTPTPIPRWLPKPCFLMSWRRRIPKEDEALFFNGCRAAGFSIIDYGSRVYCIHPSMIQDCL